MINKFNANLHRPWTRRFDVKLEGRDILQETTTAVTGNESESLLMQVNPQILLSAHILHIFQLFLQLFSFEASPGCLTTGCAALPQAVSAISAFKRF